MKIENYGNSERCLGVMRLLLKDEAAGVLAETHAERIILLPIPTARDGVHITGTDKLISELLLDIQPTDFVVGYDIPLEDKCIIHAVGAELLDVAEDSEFLDENAKISAIGALSYILSLGPAAPMDTVYGIVGWGRIGSSLAQMLMYLGGEVRVYTSNNSTRLTLSSYGIDTVSYERHEGRLPDISGVNILINTAPTPLSSSFPDGRIPDGLRVVELASGNNFSGISGILPLPSIPDRYYPRSAAICYYKAIMRALSQGGA